MLKTENPKNAEKALKAFKKSVVKKRHDYYAKQNNDFYLCHFEHGQLWITCSDGAAWSVVDAEGVESVNGFDFEQVSFCDE